MLSLGGVAPHITPVRAHQASLGTICAVSRCIGAGSLVLRGPHGSRRLGRGGGSRSGSSLGRGGDHPPCLGGWGPGPPRLAGLWGGGGRGGVAPRPPWSPSGRGPAVLNPGPLRVAGVLPSGVRVRSGLKCRPGVGGGEGRPVDRSFGGPCRPLPSLSGLWSREGHVGRGLHTVPLCALPQHASVGSQEQVPPPLPPPRRRPFWGGGRPPGSLGAEGRACGSPAGGVVGGGVGGPLPRPLSGLCGRGGGSGGGPLVPWRRLLTAGGEGAAWQFGPGGQPSAGGSRPSPAPLYLEPDPRAGPRWGPSSPRPLSRGAGRPRAAVRVSGQWLAGCRAAGSPPRSLSPPSLLWEVARSLASCRTVGGAWVGGPSSPPHSLASAVWAITCAAACVGAGAVAAAGCAGGSASGRGRCAKLGGASCLRPHL